jgi:hypothetical protein
VQARACPGRISAEQEAGKSVATTPQHAGTQQPVPLGWVNPYASATRLIRFKKRRCRRPRQELHRDTAGSGSPNISWTDLVRRLGELDHEPGGRGNGRSGSAVLSVGERGRRQRMVGDGRMGADTERARVGLGHHGREKLPRPNRSAEWASQHPAASLRVRRAGGLQHGRDQCVHERTGPGYHSGHRGSCHEVRVGPVS